MPKMPPCSILSRHERVRVRGDCCVVRVVRVVRVVLVVLVGVAPGIGCLGTKT